MNMKKKLNRTSKIYRNEETKKNQVIFLLSSSATRGSNSGCDEQRNAIFSLLHYCLSL